MFKEGIFEWLNKHMGTQQECDSTEETRMQDKGLS